MTCISLSSLGIRSDRHEHYTNTDNYVVQNSLLSPTKNARTSFPPNLLAPYTRSTNTIGHSDSL